jgi:hypothetical protein
VKEIEEIAIDMQKKARPARLRIRFSSGHKIVALSSRPSNLRGSRGRAVIDGFPRRPQGAAQGGAGLYDVGRMCPRDVHP